MDIDYTYVSAAKAITYRHIMQAKVSPLNSLPSRAPCASAGFQQVHETVPEHGWGRRKCLQIRTFMRFGAAALVLYDSLLIARGLTRVVNARRTFRQARAASCN